MKKHLNSIMTSHAHSIFTLLSTGVCLHHDVFYGNYNSNKLMQFEWEAPTGYLKDLSNLIGKFGFNCKLIFKAMMITFSQNLDFFAHILYVFHTFSIFWALFVYLFKCVVLIFLSSCLVQKRVEQNCPRLLKKSVPITQILLFWMS